MNILIATMQRSGSTALYCMIKKLIEKNGAKCYACFAPNFRKEKTKEYNLVKIHEPSIKFRDWADIIITTYRDPVEAMCSWNFYRPSYFRGVIYKLE